MMQGDAYSVPVTITAQDGTVVTPDMVTCVEITIGNLSRKYPGAVTFDEDAGAWQFPLTQQQTFRLSQGKQETQARVVFASGDVFGGRGDTVFVTGSLSKGVLPQPEKETAGIVAPSISQVRLGSAGKIRATVGSAKVVLTSSLPPISETTKGQYLTNDGTEAKWGDVDALPAMSGDTAGKMLTNDGENAEWGGAVRYDVAQNLTDANKRLGRSNIDAVTIVRNVSNVSQLPDIMWDTEHLCAIELTPISNFADLVEALTTAGLSNLDNNVRGFLQYMTSIPFLIANNELAHVFQLFTTANEQALVTVSQSMYGSHDIRSYKATKTADWANFVVAIISDRDSSGNMTYTADKSFSEIIEASRKGKNVVANLYDSGACLPLTSNKHSVEFKGFAPYKNSLIIISVNNDESVTYEETPITDESAVHFTEQTLTTDQQAQARKNIGAGDNTLGITGARVGQIAKITAVDASGVPTAWSPVDMAGGDKWEKLIDTSLAESVESVTYTFDDCKRTKALIAPALASDESYSGWTRISINNVSYPLFNSKVDAIKGIYFAVDSVYPPYVQASLGTNSNTSTYGFIGGIQTTALENIAPNGITELGCQTAELLKAGTKIEIWGVKS